MKKILHFLTSYLPSQKGAEALSDLKYILEVRGGISFSVRRMEEEQNVYYIAESKNIHNKSIVVTGKNLDELDKNIKDAIFTLYQVPAYYAKKELIKSPDFVAQNNSVSLQYAS